jgi:hypothetical protein
MQLSDAGIFRLDVRRGIAENFFKVRVYKGAAARANAELHMGADNGKDDRPESFLWITRQGMNSTLRILTIWTVGAGTVFWWKTGISNLPFGGTSSTMAVQSVGNALVRKGSQPVPGGSSATRTKPRWQC